MFFFPFYAPKMYPDKYTASLTKPCKYKGYAVQGPSVGNGMMRLYAHLRWQKNVFAIKTDDKEVLNTQNTVGRNVINYMV